MFYKPNFCCHCGEKIDRIDWNLLTSRRFCPVCETEQKPHDLIPRVVIGFALIVGLFGFGSYLQSGKAARSDPENLSRGVSPERRTATTDVDRKAVSANSVADTNSKFPAGQSPEFNERDTERLPANSQSSPQPGIKTITSEEPVYFCGALTKKGTPCSRRVKPKGSRCWQHSGRPAIAEPLKTTAKF